MAAKAVVGDVGRVMEWGYNRTDELAKLIPFQPGKLITLEDARRMEPRLAEREQAEEETRELLAPPGPPGGRAHRAGQAPRLLPAVCGRRVAERGVPARQGRRRGDRPGEVRLPRADDAHRARMDRALREAARAAGLLLRA